MRRPTNALSYFRCEVEPKVGKKSQYIGAVTHANRGDVEPFDGTGVPPIWGTQQSEFLFILELADDVGN